MDFTLPESADDVRGLSREIAEKISSHERVAELESADAPIDADLWRELAAAGLLGLEVPSSVAGDAGGDLTPIENMVVAEELGRTLARVPFGPHALAALPVLAARATDPVRGWTVGPGAIGEVVVTCAVEEDLGADPLAPQTRVADGVLTGTKVDVPYASAATAFLVNAAGPNGPVAVVVRADDPGVHIISTAVTGRTPAAQVDFDGVQVPDDHVLSGGGDAVIDITTRLTLALCADQTGVAGRALELTAQYAREREQFGRAIGSFQAVAQRLADGYIDLQGLSLTTTQAAWMLAGESTDGPSVTDSELHTAIGTAKFWATEAGHRIAHTAVHVHGGVGLDTSHPVHRYFLRAKQNEFALGSAPVVLAGIGAELADTPV